MVGSPEPEGKAPSHVPAARSTRQEGPTTDTLQWTAGVRACVRREHSSKKMNGWDTQHGRVSKKLRGVEETSYE